MNCRLVRLERSRATRSPIIVTARAASFMWGVIVITGVLSGEMFEVISRPATMLPQANRLIGLMTAGLFSLIGGRGLNRGRPIVT